MRKCIAVCLVTGGLWLCGGVSGVRADQPAANPPTADQVQQLINDNQELKKENQDLQKRMDALEKRAADNETNAAADQKDTEDAIKKLQDEANDFHLGTEEIVIAGDANMGFTTQRGTNSTFSATVSPLILWRPGNSNWLFEGAFGFDSTGAASLGLANLSYTVSDWLIVGGGLFTTPMGQYHNHTDPPWVDKFPDDPLYADMIIPITETGFFVRGAIPSGTTKWTYDAYVVNGPQMDPNTGNVTFSDSVDNNNNKAVGGRIGFDPFPDMEAGYSVQYGKVQPDLAPVPFPNTNMWIQAVDFSYKPTWQCIDGQIDFRTEWAWSQVQNQTYLVNGFYNNYSDGGYVQAGYRPTLMENKVLRNIELLGRWDTVKTPEAGGGDTMWRYTIGVDYWFTPAIVAKMAYEFNKSQQNGNQDALLFEVGIGL